MFVGIVLFLSNVRIAEQSASVLSLVSLSHGLQSRMRHDLSVSADRAHCKAECNITVARIFLVRKAGQSPSYGNRFFILRFDAGYLRLSAHPQLALTSEDESYAGKVRRSAYPQLVFTSEDGWNAENVCRSACL